MAVDVDRWVQLADNACARAVACRDRGDMVGFIAAIARAAAFVKIAKNMQAAEGAMNRLDPRHTALLLEAANKGPDGIDITRGDGNDGGVR